MGKEKWLKISQFMLSILNTFPLMKIESETKDKSFVSLQKGEANPYITSVKRSSQAQISRYFAEKKKKVSIL